LALNSIVLSTPAENGPFEIPRLAVNPTFTPKLYEVVVELDFETVVVRVTVLIDAIASVDFWPFLQIDLLCEPTTFGPR